MKIGISGGSGFIGSYFYRWARRHGHGARILDLVPPRFDVPEKDFVRGDVRDSEAVAQAFNGCDRVLHLAAAHHDFGIDPETFYRVNVDGSGVICDVTDELGIRDVTFFSTVAVYGDAPEPRHEGIRPRPNSAYGQSKLAAEEVFRQWTERGDQRSCLVIRPTVTFGPYNFANMYTLIDQIYRGRFVIAGKADNVKSLSYVENLVEATVHLWHDAKRTTFEVVNYIDKPDLTSKHIILAVYEALGKKPWPRLPMWLVRGLIVPFDLTIALTGKNLPISSARAKKLFEVQTRFEAYKLRERGFVPRVPLPQGIRNMVQWYLEEKRERRSPPVNDHLIAGERQDLP